MATAGRLLTKLLQSCSFRGCTICVFWTYGKIPLFPFVVRCLRPCGLLLPQSCICHPLLHKLTCLPRWLMSGWCKVNVPIHDHLSKWCAASVLHIPWCFIGSKRGIFQSLKRGCNLKRKALLSLSWIILLCIVGHVHLGFCAAMAKTFLPQICTFWVSL